jgi:hypothetical protein
VYLAIAHTFLAKQTTAGPQVKTYAQGDRFADVPNLDLSQAPTTLVLWIRSTCVYCTRSMAFYQTLVAQPRKTRIVAMSDEPLETIEIYLREHQVRVDQIIPVDRGTVRLSGTPAAVLVGSDHLVRKVWTGMLREPEQAKVVQSLD